MSRTKRHRAGGAFAVLAAASALVGCTAPDNAADHHSAAVPSESVVATLTAPRTPTTSASAQPSAAPSTVVHSATSSVSVRPAPRTSQVTTVPPHPATPASSAVLVQPTPTPTVAANIGCYPLTNGGNCYEPGEFCRKSDHGASGIAGDGKHISCEDNNGWRWEPTG